ncbi:YgjP-like metallopeptidase domain-containing protein [Chromobacterium sphagni]|uniref:Metal-dependent hydrolase n=1 Tax=Chromobacterium sphagni TaxID=1903179 RepID=A0A1S1WYD7_9NEIS|nr:YgjP-like metallopeptidase domain-containing protein [Chromobacterium sphagni]OHX12317.1 metal-dependent hydrolase [Chromobacterium sphagni]OHX21599.1 metal-dependent hydrolase [Chromobacterium sphagni]
MSTLKYLLHYPPALVQQAQALLDAGQLGPWLRRKYPDANEVQTDKALYQFVAAIKQRYLKNAPLPAKVLYDNQQHPLKGTLGTNTLVSRVQGGKLKSKSEIRIAALFRELPLPFLQMIVVHELAHLKERDHDKAFYQLCCHMLPDYHQLEFDLRLWLSWRELETA